MKHPEIFSWRHTEGLDLSKEAVKLTLEVPKGVVDFLTDPFKLGCIGETYQKLLEDETVRNVISILGSLLEETSELRSSCKG